MKMTMISKKEMQKINQIKEMKLNNLKKRKKIKKKNDSKINNNNNIFNIYIYLNIQQSKKELRYNIKYNV